MPGVLDVEGGALREERAALGVRRVVRGATEPTADRGAGLLVRVDRRGGTVFAGAGDDREGGLALWETGSGVDSFRRFVGGAVEVGEGVGRDFAADGGLDTTTVVDSTVEVVVTVGVAFAVVLLFDEAAVAAAAFPDLLYDAAGSGAASTTALIRSPSAYALPSSRASSGLTQVPARRVMLGSLEEPLFPLRS